MRKGSSFRTKIFLTASVFAFCAWPMAAGEINGESCRQKLEKPVDFDAFAEHLQCYDSVRGVLVVDPSFPVQGPVFLKAPAAGGHWNVLLGCGPSFASFVSGWRTPWDVKNLVAVDILRPKGWGNGELLLWVTLPGWNFLGGDLPLPLSTIVNEFQAGVPFAQLVPAMQSREVPFWEARGELPQAYILLDEVSCVDNERYRCYSAGRTLGVLRFFTLDSWERAVASGGISRTTVVVLKNVPFVFDIPVAGIITAEPQGLFAHVDLLARREGIPNIFLPGAWEEPRLRQFEGKPVRFTAQPGVWSVEEAGWSDVAESLAQRRPQPILLKKPVDSFELLSLRDAAGTFPVQKFGGKFAHMAFFYDAIPPENRVEGFGISFGYFRSFLETNRVPGLGVTPWSYILQASAGERFVADPVFRRRFLESFRRLLRRSTTVDRELVQAIAEKARDVFGDDRIKLRFRSSSNAEDSLFFPGAGLYDSTSGCPADSLDPGEIGPCLCDPEEPRERTVERALRKVWASLWNDRAWEERWWYGIEEGEARMGILVTPAFLNERANGVAMTGSPSDPTDSRYFVSAQVGEASVVRPEPGSLPELDLLTPLGDGRFRILRIQRSSLLQEGFVLSEDVLMQLGRILSSLQTAYRSEPGVPEEIVRLEIEFKIPYEGGLKVKQVRPFLLPGSERLLAVRNEISAVFPGRVFVTVAKGKEDILSYHLHKVMLRLGDSEFLLPEVPGGKFGPWIEHLSVGPQRNEVTVSSQGEARLSFDLSDWSAGRGLVVGKLVQNLGDFNIETDQLFSGVDLWGPSVRCVRLKSQSLRVASPEGDRIAVCIDREAYPLFEKRVSGSGGIMVRLFELHLAGGAKLPLRALVSFGGKSIPIREVSRLSWARRLPPLREAYLLEPTESLGDVCAFEVVYRIGVREPEPVLLGEAYREIGRFGLQEQPVRLVRRAGEVHFIRGDVDTDGSVTLQDAVRLLEGLFGGSRILPCPDAADVTDDGRLTVSDAVVLLRKLFGPTPWPEGCSVDRTEDMLGACEYPLDPCLDVEE